MCICAGLSMYLVGNISNAVGLSLAPQSDFAAVGVLTLVTNAMYVCSLHTVSRDNHHLHFFPVNRNSKCFLNEQLNRVIIAGIAVIILGSSMAVLFGAKSRGMAKCNSPPKSLQIPSPSLFQP